MKRKLFSLSGALLLATAMFAQNNVSYNVNNVPIGSTYNTAVGWQSLISVTGTRNSALGYEALKANTSGFSNTGVGSQALTANTIGAFNTAIGMQSMNANLSGVANSGLGYQSLYNNTSGNYNAATGLVSLNANTTGSNNTGHGVASLYTNTTGSGNTAIGYYADVTTGNLTNATAIGNEAKVSASNTIQLGNNAVTEVYAGTGTTAKLIAGGLQITGGVIAPGKVLMSDASGNATWQTPAGGGSGWTIMGNAGTVDGTNFIGTTDNVALNFRMNNLPAGRIEGATGGNTCFGYRTGNLPGGSGVKNTAMGYYALQANTSGRENVAIGYNALKANQIGNFNTATGYGALEANTSAEYNTATGYATLANNTTGTGNTATGYSALFYNTVGFQNTVAGYQALHGNTSGAQNTCMGSVSLIVNSTGHNNVGIGYASLGLNTTGFQNVAVGANALYNNTTGSNNSALGYYANVSTTNLTNATAIGANAIVNASNKIRLGNTTVTVVEGPVGYTISDGRFKTNIAQDDVKGLDFINRLRPVVYNMDTRKFQEFLTQGMADSVRAQYMDQDFAPSTAIRQSGFIAQEVEQAAKESGYNFNGVHVPEGETDNYSLAYSQFVVPLVKGMQEQQAMIEAQNAAIAQQQAQIEALQKLVAAMAAHPADKGAATTTTLNDAVAVYPNPSNGTFTIFTQTLDQGRIEVVNASGNAVQTVDLVKGVFSYDVNLSTQAKGVYVVRILAGEQVITKKVVLE